MGVASTTHGPRAIAAPHARAPHQAHATHAVKPSPRGVHVSAPVGAVVHDSHGRRIATLPAQRMPGGVLVVPETQDGKQVSAAEMQQAIDGLRKLPPADLALVASHGVEVHLYPVAGLEDGLLGATTIIQDRGSTVWKPTLIRVAARAGLTGSQSLPEIVQHEFGHAVSVLRAQDRSEEAAIAYAKRY